MNNSDLTTLKKLLSSYREWLISRHLGETFALNSNEIEIEAAPEKVLFSFINDRGFQTWRIIEIEFEGSKILLLLTRNFGTENERFVLVPRTKAEEFGETVELARLVTANRIADLLTAEYPGIKLKRVELNRENGRFAQITIEDMNSVRKAAIADVSGSLSPEILLSSAAVWLTRLGSRKKDPIEEIWILSETSVAKKLRKLHACLTEKWKNKIRIYSITSGNSDRKISQAGQLNIGGLWRYKPKKLSIAVNKDLSNTARRILELAPKKIDHIFSGNGETLRYLGLPFLRTRKISGEETTWYGSDRSRQLLNEDSFEEFYEFFARLQKYRTAKTPNPQHIFFQMAPEAWLESMLRQNIKLLDANLILSPIYNQFRTSQDKIDLLALRKDGRLVIIELKVFADREMIYQAVDYWRKIELQRRKGDLNKANLFGELEIADKPAIVYLVAPTLSYHRDLQFLSKTISSEIEIFRFDLAENWREGVKVLRRRRGA
ncbi:MAG: hypothetical protein KDB79_07250 [Acidobacteria bacterium]|nr:hypothetical protein [Acidobacteriota bacterium]